MKKLVSRLLASALMLIIATALSSAFLVNLVGDPIYFRLNSTRDLESSAITEIRDKYHLHSWKDLYFSWLFDIFHGKLGLLRRGGPISAIMPFPFLRTAILCTITLSAYLLLSLFLVGGMMVAKKNILQDRLLNFFLALFQGIPLFIAATFLWAIYSRLGLFSRFPSGLIASAFLPASALLFSDGMMASLISELKAEVLWLKSSDFIRAARAKGLPEWKINPFIPGCIAAHILRNMMVVIIERLRSRIIFIIGGALVVERVFNYDGVGTLLLDEALSQGLDFNLIMGILLFVGLLVIFLRAVADLLLALLDPRQDQKKADLATVNDLGLGLPKNKMDNWILLKNTLFPKMNRMIKRRYILVKQLSLGLGAMIIVIFISQVAGSKGIAQALVKPLFPALALITTAISAALFALFITLISEILPQLSKLVEWGFGILESIPLYFIAVIISQTLSTASQSSTWWVMALTSLYLTITTTRVIKGKFAEEKGSEAYFSGISGGAGKMRLNLFYLLPSCMVNMATTICDQAGYTLHIIGNLAFLGVGEYHQNLAAISGRLGGNLFRLPNYLENSFKAFMGQTENENYTIMIYATMLIVILIMTLNSTARTLMWANKSD